MNKPKTVAKLLEELALRGQFYFTLDDLAKELGHKKYSLSVSLSRLSKIGKVQMIRNGFGIITAQTSGSLHPSYFLDAMMKYLDIKYYVGLLNAAAYKGASHQAVMNFTVVTDKLLKPIKLKTLTIDFITKSHFEEITDIEKVAGIGGYYFISSPELTAIDIVRFPKKSGHLNNVATVLQDLSESINREKFKKICEKISTPTAALQRLGYILDRILKNKQLSTCVVDELSKRKTQRVLLSLANKKTKRQKSVDQKWNLIINTQVEPDE
jgi:predicted transcriptional regulator of viral defense system